MRKYLIGGVAQNSVLSDIALTSLRVFTGLTLAFAHGLPNLPVSDGFIQYVGSQGYPFAFLFAWAAKLAEGVGGLLIAAGLLTRPAAFIVFISMANVALIVHRNDPFGTAELAFLYAFIALTFAVIGGGRFSIDRLIRRS